MTRDIMGDLLIHQLRDLYSAERQILLVWPQLIDRSASYTVRSGATRSGSLKCEGCDTSLPGLARAVPMRMPCELRVRRSRPVGFAALLRKALIQG